MPEGQEVAHVAYDQTIHSFLFHRIEGLFACCSINLFATDDNGGPDVAFVCCSIKLSGDNDISRRDATSLCGLADVRAVPTRPG